MANNDPVEAAKRTSKKTQEAHPQEPGLQEQKLASEPVAPEWQPKPTSGFYRSEVPDPAPIEVKKAPPVAAQVPVPAELPPLICRRYRVSADWRGSLFGQLIVLRAGEILDKGHYGDDGFRRLTDGGLRVEPYDAP